MTRALCVLLLLFSTTTARAEVSEPTSEEVPANDPLPLGESYALPIVGADAASIASFGLGGLFVVAAALGANDSGAGPLGVTLVVGGIASYIVAPPLIHMSRDNPRGAMRSAVARTGLPLLGAMVGYLSDRQADSSEKPLYGLVAGAGCAMLLDWALLARLPPSTTVFVAPADNAGMQAGLGGRF